VTEGILDGKLALVAGVANKRSIAWAIARRLHEAGARVALTYQGDRIEAGVRKLAPEIDCDVVVPLDVTDEPSLDEGIAAVADGLGGLDVLVHSIAYAPPESFAGRFVDTSREAWTTALDVSAYSLVAMARRAEPLMADRGGGSIVTMTYMASERAFPGYNVMAAAKAALECAVRYLAWELGETGTTVNAISAGPVRTLAAKGIPEFSRMEAVIEERAPLRRNIDASDVGDAAVYLSGPLARRVTGSTVYVDSGYHAMGI
jgi:enoyl-[acyl-carrier protein] reductase I